MITAVCLIGMPAVGKSTLGKILASRLGASFLDTDREISRQTHRSVNELLRDEGKDRFLEIENRVLCGIDSLSPLVLATGGSAVFCAQGMAHLAQSMTMVYLYDTVQQIEKRIPNIKTRGIVGYSEEDGLSAVFAQRDPLYRQWADLIFDLPIGFPRRPSVQAVADELAQLIIAQPTP